jgi:hypothetical protein
MRATFIFDKAFNNRTITLILFLAAQKINPQYLPVQGFSF